MDTLIVVFTYLLTCFIYFCVFVCLYEAVCASLSWIEACIGEEIPASVELEEGLRNGVVLAKLAHFITPDKVPLRKVYDKDLSRYHVRRHDGVYMCLL